MRRPVIVGILVLVGAAAVAGAWLLRLEPIAWAYTTGPGEQLFLVREEDPSSDPDSILTYRWSPGERFEVFLGLTNTAPIPVTLLGLGSGQTDADGFGGFWLEDLAFGRFPTVDGSRPAESGPAPSLAPTTLAPGDVIDIWARFRISSMCDGQVPLEAAPDYPDGGYSSVSRTDIPVSYQVLGITRTTRIQLPVEIRMVNGGPDAIETCPEA